MLASDRTKEHNSFDVNKNLNDTRAIVNRTQASFVFFAYQHIPQQQDILLFSV